MPFLPTSLALPLVPEHDRAVTLAGFPSEEHFRAFYDRTARPLLGYLRRVLQDAPLADDLLQEAYLRIMRVDLPPESGFAHRKNYLYRVATNLINDHYRAARHEAALPPDLAAPGRFDQQADLSRDVQAALRVISAHDRQLLWLAYVERFSHREMAEMLGLTEQSVRPMLWRARHRLAAALQAKGVNR